MSFTQPPPQSLFGDLLWRNPASPDFVPQLPFSIGLISATFLLIEVTPGAIRISYRSCNSRWMKIWPNNVTAWDGSWTTRDGIASGSPNLMSSLRGVRVKEDLTALCNAWDWKHSEGARFAPDSEWALKQLKVFYGKEDHTVILIESRITRAIFSCERADG